LRGEGQARTLPGQKIDGMIAIYHHPKRPDDAWILNCQSPASMPNSVKSICSTAIDSFLIELP